MDILGDVNDGWFANLAHGCENFSHGALNAISCGHGWGDQLYTEMGHVADTKVAVINQAAIDNALAHGATQHQALNAGSAEMSRLVNPQNASELWNLTKTGASTAGNTVGNLFERAKEQDYSKLLPLLIGAGVAGGAYLVADNMSGDETKSSNAPRRREQRAEAR